MNLKLLESSNADPFFIDNGYLFVEKSIKEY